MLNKFCNSFLLFLAIQAVIISHNSYTINSNLFLNHCYYCNLDRQARSMKKHSFREKLLWSKEMLWINSILFVMVNWYKYTPFYIPSFLLRLSKLNLFKNCLKHGLVTKKFNEVYRNYSVMYV